MTAPPVPPLVNAFFSRQSAPARARLLEIRSLIHVVAAETEGVGPLTEMLKWGEPAYLMEASRSGTTIRLGVVKSAPGDCAVLFNCKTTLVETFREQFPTSFGFDGNRALVLACSGPLPEVPLVFCLRAALTYHLGRRKPGTKRQVKLV